MKIATVVNIKVFIFSTLIKNTRKGIKSQKRKKRRRINFLPLF